MSWCLIGTAAALYLQHRFGDRVHAVDVALRQQAAVGVGRERALESGVALAYERSRGTALAQPQTFEADECRAGEAVVDLGELHVGRTDAGAPEELVAQQAGVVAGVVVPQEMIADVQAGPGAGTIRARRDDRRWVAQIAGLFDRRHEDRARAIDLDGAVVRAVRLYDVGRREVRLDVEWAPAIRALVAHGVLALRDRHCREVELALTGLVQEPLRPHADVHEVVVEADGVAVLAAWAVELHAADAWTAAPVERPEHQHVAGVTGGHCHRGHAGEIARRLATEIRVEHIAQLRHRKGRGDGLAMDRVVHHHEARNTVDFGSGETRVVERVAARFGGEAQHAAT